MEAYTEKAENQWENVGSDLSSFAVLVIAVTKPSFATMNPPYPAASKLRLKWVTSSGGDSLCKLTGSNFKSVMEVITESSTQFHCDLTLSGGLPFVLVVGITGIAGCKVDASGAGTISGWSRFAIVVARISILLSNNPSITLYQPLETTTKKYFTITISIVHHAADQTRSRTNTSYKAEHQTCCRRLSLSLKETQKGASEKLRIRSPPFRLLH